VSHSLGREEPFHTHSELRPSKHGIVGGQENWFEFEGRTSVIKVKSSSIVSVQ
jgi:hypothetical protein